MTRVMHRGSTENLRAEVPPAAPEVLSGDLKLDSKSPEAKRRAHFAEWATSQENPLLARVMVNRIWQHVFGRGLVVTASDFGKAGARPSHPKLLDWLASEFMLPVRSNAVAWSVKDTLRLLLYSDAFQRSSRPAAHKADEALLWRFPPRRVEAEVIRDGILLASGKLDTKIGGRSYRIHNVKKPTRSGRWSIITGRTRGGGCFIRNACGAWMTRFLPHSIFPIAARYEPSGRFPPRRYRR